MGFKQDFPWVEVRQENNWSKHMNMEQVWFSHGQVFSYFLIGWPERVLNAVSAPDLALLNTEGATLPIFSVKNRKQQ